MIYYLMDAYDSEIRKIMNRKVIDLDKYEKVLLGIVILGGIISGLCIFMPYEKLRLIGPSIYIMLFVYCAYMLSRIHKKRYTEYLQKYDEKLKAIKGILDSENIKINTSAKLEHLILQYEEVIQEKKKSRPILSIAKGYCYVVILPIVIYLFQHAIDEISIEQAIQFIVSLVGILIVALLLFVSVYVTIEPVINRKIYNMEQFKEELKDLYRRDYLE